MKLVLNRQSPLGIKDQIRRQIRMLIESGKLHAGKALPSAKDMAAVLSINRNTVAAAYRELVAEGYLKTVVGAGTFVREHKQQIQTDRLCQIFSAAMEEALTEGYTPDQITDFLLDRLTTTFGGSQGKRVLVVECNQEALEDIAGTLQRELGVVTSGVLVQDLEADPAAAAEHFADVDLIVCGFNHVEELRHAIPDCPLDVVPVILKPHIRIMSEIMRLPKGTRVGFCCSNQRSTETFFRALSFSGGSSLITICAGLENAQKLKEMLADCEVVFATGYVHERVAQMVSPDKRVIRVDLSVDDGNIQLVREALSIGSAVR